jgi:hypothetical protein
MSDEIQKNPDVIAAKLHLRDGTYTELNIPLTEYAEAYESHNFMSTHLNAKYNNDLDLGYGDAFTQVLASQGVRLRRDPVSGAGASKMSLIRPDGSQALTIAGRLLFPAVFEQYVLSELMVDSTAFEGVYNQMVGQTVAVDSPMVFQPIINIVAPKSSRFQPISSGAEPATMMTISTSSKVITIPQMSIGLEIDDQAARNITIDVVGTMIQQNLAGQRIHLIKQALANMISGDVDSGITALSSENSYDAGYDTASVSLATFSNKAWVKWLRKDWEKMTIDYVICDLETSLAIENRTGRPTVYTDAGNDTRLTSIPNIVNSGIPGGVKIFVVDSSVIGTGTIIGIDSRKAIKKYLWAGGNYQATERYVMRRTEAMRWDIAELTTRMLPGGQGWKKLNLIQ